MRSLIGDISSISDSSGSDSSSRSLGSGNNYIGNNNYTTTNTTNNYTTTNINNTPLAIKFNSDTYNYILINYLLKINYEKVETYSFVIQEYLTHSDKLNDLRLSDRDRMIGDSNRLNDNRLNDLSKSDNRLNDNSKYFLDEYKNTKYCYSGDLDEYKRKYEEVMLNSSKGDFSSSKSDFSSRSDGVRGSSNIGNTYIGNTNTTHTNTNTNITINTRIEYTYRSLFYIIYSNLISTSPCYSYFKYLILLDKEVLEYSILSMIHLYGRDYVYIESDKSSDRGDSDKGVGSKGGKGSDTNTTINNTTNINTTPLHSTTIGTTTISLSDLFLKSTFTPYLNSLILKMISFFPNNEMFIDIDEYIRVAVEENDSYSVIYGVERRYYYYYSQYYLQKLLLIYSSLSTHNSSVSNY